MAIFCSTCKIFLEQLLNSAFLILVDDASLTDINDAKFHGEEGVSDQSSVKFSLQDTKLRNLNKKPQHHETMKFDKLEI